MITAYDFINDKRNGKAHSDEDIAFFVREYVKGNIPDYQASAWLMAVCLNGMTSHETAVLTKEMMNSGEVYDLGIDAFTVDKHSTGGVGDKVTLFAGPVCAVCGASVPKMSGKGLGHTGGTIDKLASIPGFRTDLSRDEFVSVVNNAGFAVAGQTKDLVPADKKLYSLRDSTATVQSIPLICSSIMSKKLATGADGIVLDVKVGSGAFMKNTEEAEILAKEMISVGEEAGRKCVAILTDMDSPLGKTVGNSLEVIEAVEALKGNAPKDFREVAYAVSAQMLMLSGYGTEEECMKAVEDAVTSGKALDKFREVIRLQGGDPSFIDDYSLLGEAKYKKQITASRSGYINSIACDETGRVSLLLGAGRNKKDDPIDYTAGVRLIASVGDRVEKGDVIAEIMSSTVSEMDEIASVMSDNFEICDDYVKNSRKILKIIKSN